MIAALAAGMFTMPYATTSIQAAQAAGTESWNFDTSYTKMMMTPGKDASQVNFAWYSEKKGEAMVQVALKANMNGTTFPETADTYNATTTKAILEGSTQYYTNKVTAYNFQPNTAYVYRYTADGGKTWSETCDYKTKDFNKFQVLYVGDPQIGSSGNVVSDTAGWQTTLTTATAMFPNLAYMISVGDQVEKADNSSSSPDKKFENEMAGYLNPLEVRSLPIATVVGNHEYNGANLQYHTFNPNESAYGKTEAGSDYYYSYGSTLFITLNTADAYKNGATNVAEHETLIQEAIANTPNAKWRVVSFHQDVYGSGEPHSNSDGADLRNEITPMLDKYDIDVVLTGHDHSYTRSYQMDGGQPLKEQQEDKEGRVINPTGTVYMTANSASGSKFYDVVPEQQYYVAARNQENVTNFSVLNIDDVSFSIDTYRTDDLSKVDTTYTIVKSAKYQDLLTLITSAQDTIAKESNYTPASYATFKSALDSAMKLQETELDETIIGTSYADLNNAINALQEKGNKDQLKVTLASTKKLLEEAVVGDKEGNYKQETKDVLQGAFDKAKNVDVDENAIQAAIDAENADLKAAVETFKNKKIGAVKQETTTTPPSQTVKPTSTSTVKPVNTGDTTTDALTMLGGLMAIAAIGGCTVYVRKKRSEAEIQ